MERDNLRNVKKQLADLNEAVVIAEERTENAITEKERILDKNKDYIHKMQSMKDDIQEKELLIQEYDAKQKLLADEKKLMIETKDRLQQKLDDYNENYIIIPRSSDKPGIKIEEDQESKNMDNIHEEIRKLHFQIKQKDQVIL